jgi:hypothetical protein
MFVMKRGITNKEFKKLVSEGNFASVRLLSKSGLDFYSRLLCVLNSNHFCDFFYNIKIYFRLSKKERDNILILIAQLDIKAALFIIEKFKFLFSDLVVFSILYKDDKNKALLFNSQFLYRKAKKVSEVYSLDLLFKKQCFFEEKCMDSEIYKISVIVPVYNVKKYVLNSIESLLQQSYKNIEIIIIDDCSTDGSYEIIKEKYNKEGRVSLYRTSKNSGPFCAKNIGLMKSSGDYITFLDGDDFAHSNRIEYQLLDLLSTDKKANLSNWYRVSDIDGKTIVNRKVWPLVRLNMGSLMMHRDVFEIIGYFHEIRFGADQEYVDRVILKFGSIRKIHIPLTLASQRDTSLSLNTTSGYGGKVGNFDRQRYLRAYKEYHIYCVTKKIDPYYSSSASLPFKIPDSMRL